MELVTAVITTHKREPNIVERALLSIINQTYSAIQIVVVDDSPSDYPQKEAVKNMVERYADKNNNIVYMPHDECRGACAARNTGLSMAKGKYIAFLDDDDEWVESKIEKQISAFINDKIALVYCGSSVLNEATNIMTERKTIFKKGNVYPDLIMENFIGSTSFPLMRTDCLNAIGGFDVLMQSAQDFDVWLRLASKYEVNYVEDPLVIYHTYPGVRISVNPLKRIAGQERINEKNKEYILSHRVAYWIRNLKLSEEYAKSGQLGKTLKLWLKASIKCPLRIKTNIKYLYVDLSRCRIAKKRERA